ncbi:hypothetical protein CC80DRAFT_502704 [Byssothecium circinans]|uniref:AB hydrolase-1 domain-containing protein n=1 Tax=Byssothecium circinans TaxID=147558 RepID=A0A6A5UCF4_9PLEO|nr:hypothetical protein CC80DRAFT_502704 [Byssothecium circinans]
MPSIDSLCVLMASSTPTHAFPTQICSAVATHPGHQPRLIALSDNIRKGAGRLKEVWLVLGETDPIIIANEMAEDAKATLGKDIVHVKVVEGAGHEVAIDRASEIVEVVEQMQR